MLTTYWLSSDLAALIWAALFIGFALHTIVSDFIYRRIPNLSLLVVLVCQSIWLIGEKLGVFPESTWGGLFCPDANWRFFLLFTGAVSFVDERHHRWW